MTETLREEALKPPAAHSLLRGQSATEIMALPYSAPDAVAAPALEQTASSTGVVFDDIKASDAKVPHDAPLPLYNMPPAAPSENRLTEATNISHEKSSSEERQSITDLPTLTDFKSDDPQASTREPARVERSDRQERRVARRDAASAERPVVASSRDLSAMARPARPAPAAASGSIATKQWKLEPADRSEDTEADAPRARWREASPEPVSMPLANTAPAAPTGTRPVVARVTAPAMTPASRAAAPAQNDNGIIHRQVIVQRAESGESPSGGAEPKAAQASGQTAGQHHDQAQTGDEGAEAGDINLLANEVYGLIKRRLAQEAERMGRSR